MPDRIVVQDVAEDAGPSAAHERSHREEEPAACGRCRRQRLPQSDAGGARAGIAFTVVQCAAYPAIAAAAVTATVAAPPRPISSRTTISTIPAA